MEIPLSDVSDPAERARRAGELIDEHQALVTELSRVRREAMEELLTQGMTQKQIGELVGMTRARVGQLLSSGPRPERAFLGVGTLTIALGGKLEAGKENPGSVVSAEGLATYERLAGLAQTMGLKSKYEVIPPPGFLTLNRTNLIVACGPRLSPMVQQILESDANLRFAKDGQGWHLKDIATGEFYRSGIDTGDNTDNAYIGRLPRPDGRGSFLYMAGIHAVGTSGAAHYIENNLSDMYHEVKTRRFSMLITCEFDPKTHEIRSSKPLTPVYRHEGIS